MVRIKARENRGVRRTSVVRRNDEMTSNADNDHYSTAPLIILLITLCLLSTLLTACAGNGVGLDENGNPINNNNGTPGDDPNDPNGNGNSNGNNNSGGGNNNNSNNGCGTSNYTSMIDCTGVVLTFPSTFSDISNEVFEGGTIANACINCHSGGSAPKGLDLSASLAYDNLVSVNSRENSSLCRVKPGSPDDSYMIMKLEGASGISGAQMPLGGPYLTTAELCAIRTWIEDGALDD